MYAILLVVSVPTTVFVLGILALIFVALFLLSGIFGPMPRYEIADRNGLPANDSSDFLALMESLVDAKANRNGRLEVLTNGDCFYEAELAAIASARLSVNLEAYIFKKSAIGERYLEAMTKKARQAVRVNVVLDAFGSASATRAFFRPLSEAGGPSRATHRGW